eukprot:CAMPEP_0202392632 /NCGR_PEP_ID=MMETSP1127-20130417/92481_1 /ASSEMBLY_ACC=CAM_ASM_000462 /TAXON_ID=3047 /ORGANISM="Dunaliella tertiolecta, Strain CCMP1320" /LENGTH=773 /DNA_ID=CAMNT_0048995161 /DNA_START=24 /DNA_END=2345 /DNA_ORIENTATION=-
MCSYIPPIEDPMFQLVVLIFINFGQAITYSIPFTLAVFMVRRYEEDKLPTGAVVDEQTIGRLTGLLAAAFSFAQFCTSLLWGLISNIIGRKPVILIGTAVSLVSLVWFGFSMSFSMAISARIFGGLFNGVLGAWKCIIGESGDSLVQGKMFSNMSLAWGLGAVFGPLIGGALAQPCSNVAHMPLCEPGELFFERPFLLPCLVGGLLIVLAGIAGALLLKETLPSSVKSRQLGAAKRLGHRVMGRGDRHDYSPLGKHGQDHRGWHMGQKFDSGGSAGWHQEGEGEDEGTALLMEGEELDVGHPDRGHSGLGKHDKQSHLLARSLQQQLQDQQQHPQQQQRSGDDLDPIEHSLIEGRKGGYGNGCVRSSAHTISSFPSGSNTCAQVPTHAPPRTISTMDSCSSLNLTLQQQQQQPAGQHTLQGMGSWGGPRREGGIEMLEVSSPTCDGVRTEGSGGGQHWGQRKGLDSASSTDAAAAVAADTDAKEGGSRAESSAAAAAAAAAAVVQGIKQQQGRGADQGFEQVDLEDGRGVTKEGAVPEKAPLAASGAGPGVKAEGVEDMDEEPVVWYKNPQILLTVGAYSMTALLYCAMDELLPIYSSSPVTHGGLDMEEKDLATLLTVYGVMLMAYSAWGYPLLQRALGTLFVARLGLVAAMVTCALLPLAHTALSEGVLLSYVVLYVGMAIKAFAQSSSFTGSIVMVNAAPHASQLGTVNGIGQTMAALVRGLGPALGGIMWAASLSFKHAGQQAFPFTLVALVAIAAHVMYAFVRLPGLK